MPKFSILKQQTFITSMFLWVRNPGAAYLGSLAQGGSSTVLVKVVVTSEDLSEGGSASRITESC
jgi:hypothetical protein